jgi:DegV family protein with EDD domain
MEFAYMSYVILTDASCDVDVSILKQENLDFLPMEYSLGNAMHSCCPSEASTTRKAFYDGQRQGDLTKTSQISPWEYKTAMIPWLEKGYSVLYLALSGGLSSTCHTAAMVCETLKGQYPDVTILVIDTKAATGGMGILLERAVRNRENGMDLCENAQDLMETIPHLRHWFMVPDLQYLQRGGRVGTVAAAVGTALHICPILQINSNGGLEVIGRARGSHKAIRELVGYYEKNREERSCDPVYIVDADMPEVGDEIKEKLLALYPELMIRRCTLSPVIGAHTGPGMAAIIHIGR